MSTHHQWWKILNRPKEMNAVSTKKVLLRLIFSSTLPICPVYFHLVMPRHVQSPCYARYGHTRGIKGYVITYYLACYVRLQVQNMPYYMRLWVQYMPGCVTWENMDGANGQTGGKNRSSTFVLTTGMKSKGRLLSAWVAELATKQAESAAT